ncbi:hypothetical protein FD754_020671, partial [Muntiacus muntjak]
GCRAAASAPAAWGPRKGRRNQNPRRCRRPGSPSQPGLRPHRSPKLPRSRRAPLRGWSCSAGARALARGGGGAGPAGGAVAACGRALELAEARRRLLEVEDRRRLVSELESCVLQLHRVFLVAELRLAHRAESLGRLGGGVAQAEFYLTAHGPRLKKGSRRGRRARPPALLASALGLGSCVPWGAGRLRRGHGPEPESPFYRSPPRGPTSPQR